MPEPVQLLWPKEHAFAEKSRKLLKGLDQQATLSLTSAGSLRLLRVLDTDEPFPSVDVLGISDLEKWKRASQSPAAQEAAAQLPSYGDAATHKACNCGEFHTGAGQVTRSRRQIC